VLGLGIEAASSFEAQQHLGYTVDRHKTISYNVRIGMCLDNRITWHMLLLSAAAKHNRQAYDGNSRLELRLLI